MKPNNIIPFRSLQLRKNSLTIDGKTSGQRPSTIQVSPATLPEWKRLRCIKGKLQTILSVAERYEHPIYDKALAEGVRFCLDDIDTLLNQQEVCND